MAPEASTAIGKKLSAGVSAELDPDRVTFKSGVTAVKLILAPPVDPATAQAYWDTERSKIPAGVKVKDLTGFDRAAYGAGSAECLSISALFVIDGRYFFDFFCQIPSCSEDASVTAAHAIADRLP